MVRSVRSEGVFPVQVLLCSCFIWTTKWSNCSNLIRKMTTYFSKSIRHYFLLQLLAIAVISLPQFAPAKGFETVLGRRYFLFSSHSWEKFLQFSHGSWAASASWPGGLLKPCPICILPETRIHSDPKILGTTIKLAYCQRSRFLASLQICDWVCQPNQFSKIECCNTNSQVLASSPLFIFPTPALDSGWFTDCETKAHRWQQAHSFTTPTNSTDLENFAIRKEWNKLAQSYQ